MAHSQKPLPGISDEPGSEISGVRQTGLFPAFWGGLAGIFGFLLLAFWVGRYGVNFPWMDDWEILPLLKHYHAGTLQFGELVKQHVDHRLFVPRTIFIGLSVLFGEWDLTVQMLFSVAIAATTVGFFVWSLRRLAVPVPAALLAGLVLLSPIQWENILWGFQAQFYLLVGFTLWAVLLVALSERTGWWGFAGLAALCLANSFTMGSGMFLWGIVVVCLGVRAGAHWKQLVGWGDRGFRPGPLLAFLLAGALCAVGYFHGYVESAVELKPARVAIFLWWCVRAMGYPLLEKPGVWPLVLVAGQWLTIGVALAGWWRRRTDRTGRSRLVLMTGLLGFLLLNIVVTGYRRSGYLEVSTGGGVPSRYATIFLWGTAIFIVAAAELLGRMQRPSRWRWLGSGAMLVLTVSILAGHFDAAREGVFTMGHASGYKRSTVATVVSYLGDKAPDRHFTGPMPMLENRLKLFLEDPAMVAQLPRWLQAREGDLSIRTTGAAWTPGGNFAYEPERDPRKAWGSWNGNDALVGRVETEWIPVTQPTLILPLTGYPSRPGNSLAIVSENGRGVWVYHGNSPHENWLDWRVDVSEVVGSRVRIVGVDGTTGAGGWLGFGIPWQRSRVLSRIDAAREWLDLQAGRLFAIVVIGGIVLTFAVGVRPGTSPTSSTPPA